MQSQRTTATRHQLRNIKQTFFAFPREIRSGEFSVGYIDSMISQNVLGKLFFRGAKTQRCVFFFRGDLNFNYVGNFEAKQTIWVNGLDGFFLISSHLNG